MLNQWKYKPSQDEGDSCVSDNDWKYTDKAKHEEDVKIPANDMDINEDELDDIDDMGEDNDLLLNGDLAHKNLSQTLWWLSTWKSTEYVWR